MRNDDEAIAIVGAISIYTEKYLSTTVGKRIGYELRRTLYHHVQLCYRQGREFLRAPFVGAAARWLAGCRSIMARHSSNSSRECELQLAYAQAA